MTNPLPSERKSFIIPPGVEILVDPNCPPDTWYLVDGNSEIANTLREQHRKGDTKDEK